MQVARKFQPSSSAEPLRWILAFLLACALIAVLTCTAASATDSSGEKAIATTPVQQLTTKENVYEMPAQAVLNMYEPPQPDFLANYARTADGQWHIPQRVDSTDPHVRILILGSERPTLLDIAIYIDGQPFTAAREKLIDGLMDHATLESMVREAVKVPVPDVMEDRNPKETSGEDAEEKPGNSNAKQEQESEKPVVDVKRRASRSVAQRLVNYMASAEVKADREEIRWLMAEWTGGPALLTLGPAMSWERVSFAPLWNALDADGDGSLGAAEILAASERLSQADVDENSIVELEELTALQVGGTTSPHSYPLVAVIDDETDWQQLNSHLQAAYGRRAAESQESAPAVALAFLDRIAQSDSSISPDDLKQLMKEEADLELRVTLGGQENQLALLSATDAEAFANEKILTAVRGPEYFEFSAGEAKESEAADPTDTQVAIGAVVDGYPLFRFVDRNGDSRLSPRECRNLKNVLAALDLNGDGVISVREKPVAVRVAISRGPHVHEMLAEPSSAAREFTNVGLASSDSSPTTESTAQVPPWFTDMDRNRDGDLSRTEFLGTSEQFKELDRDQDGLIGGREVGE